jgi:hypothetical protein
MRSSHGELKRHLATLLDTDASRYGDGIGTERHKRLTAAEIDALCEVLGLGFLADETKQEQMDAIMLKLDRNQRTGVGMWDTADLVAVIEAVEEMEAADD